MEFGGSNSTALPTARESRPTANTLVCREEMSSERRRSPPEAYAAQRKSVSADIDGLPGFTISKWRPEMTIGICRFVIWLLVVCIMAAVNPPATMCPDQPTVLYATVTA
jgi:hypothetical protein